MIRIDYILMLNNINCFYKLILISCKHFRSYIVLTILQIIIHKFYISFYYLQIHISIEVDLTDGIAKRNFESRCLNTYNLQYEVGAAIDRCG